ncbi:GMC oxidoreductase [Acuticoccus yangtzensis]|uniref:GMC oxidoreductase n=1 Tax=Acuticoccus yangtzensis TaxID=1443441 RepID=UPI0009498096|nr:GMC family oxidoreductase [Acuticoccus yangtzensis]
MTARGACDLSATADRTATDRTATEGASAHRTAMDGAATEGAASRRTASDRPIEAEVVVVGAGACGAAATWRLASAGVDVVAVEAGPWLGAQDFGFASADYAARRAGPLHENPNVRAGTWDLPVDDADSPIKASTGNAVGGTTLWWAAHIPRFREGDFLGHTGGAAWPITHDDIAAHYAVNEEMMGLAAHRGDPAGPARDAAQALRQLPPLGPLGTAMSAAFDRLGWHHWPVELARGAGDLCTHDGPCDAGCPARIAAGADRCYMAPAVAAGARVLTGLRAQRLELWDGRVSGVLCATDGGTVRLAARRVILAAGGLGTPRLLLLSEAANRSGQVGRNLMLHPHAQVEGAIPLPADAAIARGQKAGLVCLEFLRPDPARRLSAGFKMQLVPEAARTEAPGRAGPGTVRARLNICVEDRPEEGNEVTLSGRLADRDGLPAARMSYRLSAETRGALDFGIARADELLRVAGAQAVAVEPLKRQAGFHIMGTARMGTDPETSVTDPFGRCHDVANLFITDPSVFVTASAMNPTATAQALALRTADHILAER